MKWEYRTAIEANCYDLNRTLNKLGEKGWEAYSGVRIDYLDDEVYIAYLKRPKRKPKKRNRHDNRTT